MLLGRRCTRTCLLRATSSVILVNILFRFLIFYDRICFSIEIPFKNVQVVIQVVNNKKVMAKPPREANLYGNWCVRKGLILHPPTPLSLSLTLPCLSPSVSFVRHVERSGNRFEQTTSSHGNFSSALTLKISSLRLGPGKLFLARFIYSEFFIGLAYTQTQWHCLFFFVVVFCNNCEFQGTMKQGR